MSEPLFTEDDGAAFDRWQQQARQADPVIARNYAELAGDEGAWVAFLDGELVARSQDPSRLRDQVEHAGHPWDEVFTRYLPGKDAVLVFQA